MAYYPMFKSNWEWFDYVTSQQNTPQPDAFDDGMTSRSFDQLYLCRTECCQNAFDEYNHKRLELFSQKWSS